MDDSPVDLAVVGGGIVGLATAWRFLERRPGASVVVLEKEDRVAAHQSGHNSGVLHTGIYYRPGTLRAQNCRLGKLAMQEFCSRHGIPFQICGKVIVATDREEAGRLQGILERGEANGVECRMIGPGELRDLEPHAAGVQAIHVPRAGIVDYRAVCQKLAELIAAHGGAVRLNCRLDGVDRRDDELVLSTSAGPVRCRQLATCAGLQADRVTKLTGQPPAAPIVPFRGEYFVLRPAAEHLCRALIYPTPDPRFPFLGVHFTRVIQGGVECGPNAVLAFAREGYRKFDVNVRDLFGAVASARFLRLAAKYWRVGAGEVHRSLNRKAFVAALQRLVPGIRLEHLVPAPAGVRAQAVGRQGELIDDFVIQESDRVINVGNAPSPAATTSLRIGEMIVDKILARRPA